MDSNPELVCIRRNGSQFPGSATFGCLDTLRGVLHTVVVVNVEDKKETLQKLHASQHALRMQLSLVNMQFAAHVPQLGDNVDAMKVLVDRAIKDVRHIDTALRPAALNLGLAPALEWLRDEFLRHNAAQCTLQTMGELPPMDESRAMLVYRIVQESLTNVSRYAKAREVTIVIAFAEDAIVRAGLKQLFAIMPDMEVVAQAMDGESTLQALRHTRCDIVLMDLNMPGRNGPDLIARVKSHWPSLPILVLSMHDTAQVALRALKAGAHGYVTKDSEPMCFAMWQLMQESMN